MRAYFSGVLEVLKSQIFRHGYNGGGLDELQAAPEAREDAVSSSSPPPASVDSLDTFRLVVDGCLSRKLVNNYVQVANKSIRRGLREVDHLRQGNAEHQADCHMGGALSLPTFGRPCDHRQVSHLRMHPSSVEKNAKQVPMSFRLVASLIILHQNPLVELSCCFLWASIILSFISLRHVYLT